MTGVQTCALPISIAHQLNAAVTRSRKKTFKVFGIADGGSEHCHGDNRIIGSNYVADWFAENL